MMAEETETRRTTAYTMLSSAKWLVKLTSLLAKHQRFIVCRQVASKKAPTSIKRPMKNEHPRLSNERRCACIPLYYEGVRELQFCTFWLAWQTLRVAALSQAKWARPVRLWSTTSINFALLTRSSPTLPPLYRCFQNLMFYARCNYSIRVNSQNGADNSIFYADHGNHQQIILYSFWQPQLPCSFMYFY